MAGMFCIANTKSYLSALTRPVNSMSSRKEILFKLEKYEKRKWSKRVRGYFKSQVKTVLGYEHFAEPNH